MKPTLNNPIVRSGQRCPFFPTGDRVLVEKMATAEEMVGGIVIPEKEQAISLYATVIAAGPLAMDVLRDMGIGVGDTVCIGKYSGVVWEWRPDGQLKFERVDVINVKDVFGGVELADKIVSGQVQIGLYKEADGIERHRFFQLVDEVKEAA